MQGLGGKSSGPDAVVATIAILAIASLVIAVAGTAGYFLAARSLGTPANTASLSTTSTVFQAVPKINESNNNSSAMSSSTPSTTIGFTKSISSSTASSDSFNRAGIVTTWKNYLGNFSQITVEYSEFGQPNSTFGYRVIGHPVVNSTALTEVNLTVTNTVSFTQSSLIGWFDPEGNAIMLTEGGYNFTGSLATNATLGFASAFEVGFFTSGNLAILDSSNNLGTTSQNFGPTVLNVTSFSYNVPSVSGTTWDIRVGNLPGLNLYLLTYYTIWSGTNENVGFQLVSLTRSS